MKWYFVIHLQRFRSQESDVLCDVDRGGIEGIGGDNYSHERCIRNDRFACVCNPWLRSNGLDEWETWCQLSRVRIPSGSPVESSHVFTVDRWRYCMLLSVSNLSPSVVDLSTNSNLILQVFSNARWFWDSVPSSVITPWFMEPGGSMHSQGLSNNPYPKPN